jgi:hypothetical protein
MTGRESPQLHQRAGTTAISLRGKKANLHHSKICARRNISSILLSEENCWSSWKKTLKIQLQGLKGIRP